MKFKIVSEIDGRLCSLYTLQAVDSEESEFALALKEWEQSARPEKIRRFIQIIERSVNKYGFHPEDLTPESDSGKEEIYKFNNTGNFRFYLLFMNGMNILIPGGKAKYTRRWQDDPGLKRYITILKEINGILKELNLNSEDLQQIEIEFNQEGKITNKSQITKP